MKVRDLPIYVIEFDAKSSSPRQFLENIIGTTSSYTTNISNAMAMSLEQATKLQELVFTQPCNVVCLMDWNK